MTDKQLVLAIIFLVLAFFLLLPAKYDPMFKFMMWLHKRKTRK